MIISDAILGRENPWASFFEATRLDLTHSAGKLIGANVKVAKHFVGDKLSTMSPPSIDELAPGEGGICEMAGETVAASRDDAGTLVALSSNCTHMGCRVSWNTAEWSWDCPCHGSRFDREGRVIHAPAVQDLEPKTP
jgi:Rieske Fe-S protein